MAWKFNPFTSTLDRVSGYTKDEADDRFVNVSGDTMTGDLNLDGNKIKLDRNSYLVKNGNIVELWVNKILSASWEEDEVSKLGEPVGLLLGLTYAT